MKNFSLSKNKPFNIVSIVFFVLFLFSFTSCHTYHMTKECDSDTWKLIYENDKEGKTIKGDINLLIEAIQNGKEVRVLTYSGGSQYIANAEHLWVRNGVVHMLNTSQISVSFRGNELIVQDNPYHYYYTVNTKGERNMSRWFVGEHKSRGNNSDLVAAKWFVR